MLGKGRPLVPLEGIVFRYIYIYDELMSKLSSRLFIWSVSSALGFCSLAPKTIGDALKRYPQNHIIG